MKFSIPHTNANIPTQPHKEILQPDNNVAVGKTFWRSLVSRFWAYTDETSQADANSFKGLL